MPRPYEVFLSKSAVDYLEGRDYWERVRVLDFCEILGQHPSRDGDFTERSANGRDWQGTVIGPFAILWWVDQPISAVMVVAVRSADA